MSDLDLEEDGLLRARMGRPPKLTEAEERRLYYMHVTGTPVGTCAGFFRVSRATANRILARQRVQYRERIEPLAREFREKARAILEST